jgi:protein gp37
MTWGPVIGCERVSPGCDHCYAIPLAHMHAFNPHPKIAAASAGTTHRGPDRVDWTGVVRLLDDRLTEPFTWRKPSKAFVNSQADLWHRAVPDAFIAQIFAVMALTPQHHYQILTKRPARMRSLLTSAAFADRVHTAATLIAARPGLRLHPGDLDRARQLLGGRGPGGSMLPLPNVWLGVSVEDQQRAALRLPPLLRTPAAVRWVSAEPLLGPIDLAQAASSSPLGASAPGSTVLAGLHWVVVGGESGRGSQIRPMHPSWPLTLLRECQEAHIPCQFKQWGSWGLGPLAEGSGSFETRLLLPDGRTASDAAAPHAVLMVRCGKKRAGRTLDGRIWHDWPIGYS